MLRKICFRLSEEAAAALRGKTESLLADLNIHGIGVSGLEIYSVGAAQTEDGQDAELYSGEEKETMYLTDQPEIYAALRAQEQYVLPYYHERNRSASFPKAHYVIEELEETDYRSLDMAYRRLAGLPWEILETERLLVRETTVEDVDGFYRIYAEPSVTNYMENLCEDRDAEIAYIRGYVETVYAFYGYGMWTVLEKKSSEVIGRAGLNRREGFSLPELGFVIGVPWQGQGYAFEVCSAILRYAREELSMERVQALVRPENEKSLRLCEKLGFTVSGETELNGMRHLLLTN